MTLAEFLVSPDAWLGRQVTIEGWLHSDTVNTWLSDQEGCQRGSVLVDAPDLARWFLRHVPPRLGGTYAYCFEAAVTGKVKAPGPDGVPILGGEVSAVLKYSGRLYLRGGCA
jgi:hypothetical protein